jgi:hypothetical protein
VQSLLLNLRSRWQNKAWAQAPGTVNKNGDRAREAGGSAFARFAGSHLFSRLIPGACAPGFILSSASRTLNRDLLTLTGEKSIIGASG